MDIKQYITDNGITCEVAEVSENPAMRPSKSAIAAEQRWYREATHYSVTLHRPDGRTVETPYSCGSGIKEKPDAAGVLDCLCSDASLACNTFEDFCSETGYDEDSRTSERIWNACCETADKLRLFLGEDFDAVVYEMERL